MDSSSMTVRTVVPLARSLPLLARAEAEAEAEAEDILSCKAGGSEGGMRLEAVAVVAAAAAEG